MYSEIVQQLKQDPLPREVFDEYGSRFKIDKRACVSINKTLDTSFKAVYRCEREFEQGQLKANDLHIDTGYMFVVTSTNRILFISNSEWCSFTELK